MSVLRPLGPFVMVGSGPANIHADVLDDRSLQSLSLTDQDAAAMWRELRAAPHIKIKLAPATDELDAYARSLAKPGAHQPTQ